MFTFVAAAALVLPGCSSEPPASPAPAVPAAPVAPAPPAAVVAPAPLEQVRTEQETAKQAPVGQAPETDTAPATESESEANDGGLPPVQECNPDLPNYMQQRPDCVGAADSSMVHCEYFGRTYEGPVEQPVPDPTEW